MGKNRTQNESGKGHDEPSVALNAVCPYFTMFPLDFPLRVLKRFKNRRVRVLDPFCGRGTTIFAARIKGHKAYGIDCSPIATAIARAKLALSTVEDVTALADDILLAEENVTVPQGEFWEWAYAPKTLLEVCRLRAGLFELRSEASKILRAICLGALHGPLTKVLETRSYFSNQMPRTFSSKPVYSVKYWKKHRMSPAEVEVRKIIKARVERLQLETLPAAKGKSKICTADSRLAAGYSSIPGEIDVVITSPPYLGMKTYVADQWLRNWFLGGPPDVPYDQESSLSHDTADNFAQSLSEVWNQVGRRISPQGKMFIRFGAIPSRKSDPRSVVRESLKKSDFDWKICRIKPADSATSGKRQAELMGKRIKSAAIQEYDYEVAFS